MSVGKEGTTPEGSESLEPGGQDSATPEWERELADLRAEVRRLRQALRDVGERPARGWGSEDEEGSEA